MTDKKEGGSVFFLPCEFVAGAATPDMIPPPTITEIAFAGRSNVGKSSLINALVNRKGMARSSNTPGRTQQINFFSLNGKMMLVDLPGYGYAVAAKTKVHAWNDMVRNYLQMRQTLKRVCVLIDARHGIKAIDQATMEMLDAARVPYVAVLTKADKIKESELEELTRRIGEELKANHPLAAAKIYPTSSDKKTGIEDLRTFLGAELR